MIFKTKLFDQNLSQRTKIKTPSVIKAIAPKTWATIGASFGKQSVKSIHNNPMPSAVKALQSKVVLKLL